MIVGRQDPGLPVPPNQTPHRTAAEKARFYCPSSSRLLDACHPRPVNGYLADRPVPAVRLDEDALEQVVRQVDRPPLDRIRPGARGAWFMNTKTVKNGPGSSARQSLSRR